MASAKSNDWLSINQNLMQIDLAGAYRKSGIDKRSFAGRLNDLRGFFNESVKTISL